MSRASVFVRWSVGTALLGVSLSGFANGTAPDISGVWSRSAADVAAPAAVPPLKKKYLAAYAAVRKRAAAKRGQDSDAPEKCWVEGMPTVMAARAPLEILQTPGQVTVLAEYMAQTRRILLDENPPAEADVNPGYMGISVGKWNGDTLEVETIGIREDVRYEGMPHSGKMKILEKIRLTAPDQLQDEMTLVDPRTLTQPYHLTFIYKKEAQHRVMEYPCKHAGAAAQESQATPK